MNFLAIQNQNNNTQIAFNEEDITIDEHESIHTPQYEENFNGIMKLKRGLRRRIYAGNCLQMTVRGYFLHLRLLFFEFFNTCRQNNQLIVLFFAIVYSL